MRLFRIPDGTGFIRQAFCQIAILRTHVDLNRHAGELRFDLPRRVFKSAGEVDNARRVFQRALKLQPDCHPAQQELRELDRSSESQSFMSRLLSWRPSSGRKR